ncbi:MULTISPECIES: lipopolysaccharide assembly protein LapA domain-containing protein [unclassified Dinoroseobacter]|uniref:lipopolysaccharide assembly protein LapA domain-containing protein n=1 Tax=unclassified Dinoroseobacter TaxID=2620028 RepID=UPI003C7BF104
MRLIKYLFLAVLAICLLTIAFANNGPVTLTLLPPEMGAFAGFNISLDMPLYFVVFAGIAAGLLIGFFWEWLRETKHRNEASRQRTEARRLKREVELMKNQKAMADGKDEILALLEDSSSVR